MRLTFRQKTHAVAIAACLLALPAFAVPPPITFHAASDTDVLITGRGPDKTVRVGRPTLELHQYLLARGYALPDRDECFLVLDGSGNIEQDLGYVSLAADTYHFSDTMANSYLSPYTAVDIDALISQVEGDIFNADTWLALTLWTEFLEVARNTVIKFIIAVKTGDAELTYSAAVEAGMDALAGYVTDLLVDNFFCDKKAQRRLAVRYKQLYVEAARKRLEVATRLRDGDPLLCDTDEYTPQALYSAITAVQDGGRTAYQAWSGKLFNATELSLEGIAGNLVGQGEDVANSLVKSYVGKFVGSSVGEKIGGSATEQILKHVAGAVYAHATPVQVNGAPPPLAMAVPIKFRYRGLEQIQMGMNLISHGQEGFYSTDALYLMLWEAYDDGIIASPVFDKYSFDSFVDALVASRAEGQFLHRVFSASQRCLGFQEALIQEFYSPTQITDLSLAIEDYTRVKLTWTVPSDDMGTSDVYRHEVVYSDRPITNEALWYVAMGHWPYNGAPAGSTKTVTSGELEGGREYYFAVRGLDEEGNYGPLSNSPEITVGAGVNPIAIQLPDFPVDPEPGSSFAAAHTYFVFYKHAGGVAPRARTIYIDGNPHGMSRVPGGNYKKGTLFRYRHTTPYAAGSAHTYHYEFSSGPHTKRFPDTGELALEVDPVLYSESVKPQTSDTYELRTFRVTYRHPEAKWPTKAHLRLSNTQPVDMRMVSGTPMKGATYEARAYINRQNSDFYFDFSDGSTTFRHPASGTLSAAVASQTDAAVIRCAMPNSVECGQVLPVRPALRNVGTEWIANCTAYIKQNGTELDQLNVDYLSPGITRSGAAAFEWQVPVSDTAQSYDIEVGISPVAGETVTANNSLVFHFDVPPGRGRIAGTVYDDLGVNPVADVLVQAFSGTNDASSAYTDASGTFVIDGLIAGSYSVRGEKDGTVFTLSDRSVHALQETDVGQQILDGVGSQQLFEADVNELIYSLTISQLDGTIGYVHDDNVYLVKEDGTGLRNALPDARISSRYYGPAFSPTRAEFLVLGTVNSEYGLWRCAYDSSLNITATTKIHGQDLIPDGPWYRRPFYLPNGEDVLVLADDGALYTMSRSGGSVTQRVADASILGDAQYDLSPNAEKIVTRYAVHGLDLTTGVLVTNLWPMPDGAKGSTQHPRWTPDGQRILYTFAYSDGKEDDINLVEPFTGNMPRRITFGEEDDGQGIATRDNSLLFWVRDTAASSRDQLWKMPLTWPDVYASDFQLSNQRATLDGDGTNDTIDVLFSLNTNGLVSAKVVDVRNTLVRSIQDALACGAGTNSVHWDCRDAYGLAVDAGVYVLKVDVLPASGNADATFSYSTPVEVHYQGYQMTGEWVRFDPDGNYLYFVTASNTLARLLLQSGEVEPLPIAGVESFDVSADYILAAVTNAAGRYDFKAYSLAGAELGTWHTNIWDNVQTRNFPDCLHGAESFVYSRKLPGFTKWEISRRTSAGSETDLAATEEDEISARYREDGAKIVYSSGDFNASANAIWTMNADGSAKQRVTFHPLNERAPCFVPSSDRIAFIANWLDSTYGLWVTDSTGTRPQNVIRVVEESRTFDISPDANIVAWIGGPGIEVTELPQHLDKGSIRGRVLDDLHNVGLPGVPVRAVRGSNVVAATRSNSRGYFKLLNIREGTCEVVAGAGEYLETSTGGVSVAVAETTELGDLTVVPAPWAALSNPSPGLPVPALFPVQAQPSERCTRAEFQWRPSTNDPWTVGAHLAESNDYAVTFSCVAAGWTSGTYQVRSVGFNVSDTPDPLPVAFSVTYDTQAPTLALSTGGGGGGAAPEALAEKGGDPAPLSDPVDEATVVDFATAFVGDGDGLNTTVFDVRYPGETDWIPFASRVSTNAPDKSFDSAFIPPNMDVEFRVRSYDHAGNMQTSAVLVVRKEIPGDTDGDGMTDAYENDHGLDMNDPADGEADNDDDGLSNLAESLVGSNIEVKDSDGDGLDDWQEVYCGTSPTNNADYLKTLFGEVDPAGGMIVVKWPSADGRFYSLGRTTNLVEAFSAIVTNLPATPPENSYTDTPVNATSPHFYRIEAE